MNDAALVNQLKEINQTLKKISRSLERMRQQANETGEEQDDGEHGIITGSDSET